MNPRALVTRILGRARTALSRRFGADARALAAFRIAVALLLLVDLTLRTQDIAVFYTDYGVMPRAALREFAPTYARISIHTISGAAWVQVLLFVVAAAFALSLLVGYRTKTAAVVSWVLLVSLHARNPVILNGGDSLLRRTLFWGLFLPLGRRWSVDALGRGDGSGNGQESGSGHGGGKGGDVGSGNDMRGGDDVAGGDDAGNDDRGGWVAGVASAAMLCQLVLIYSINAGMKLSGDLWLRGDAVRYVFSLGQFTVLFGDYLSEFPALLRLFDWLWVGMVTGSFLLILLTGWPRALFASMFVGMHLGMALTMKLGIFPFVSVAALLPFLPPVFWDAVVPRLSVTYERAVDAARWRDRRDRLVRLLPLAGVSVVPAAVARWKRRFVPPALGVLFAFILLWNAATVGYAPAAAEPVTERVPTDSRWDMFAPEPLQTDGWYVVPGELESGDRVDAFHRSAVEWERPHDVSDTYPNARWRKYLVNIWYRSNAELRPHFAGHLCRRWNASHEDDLVSVTLYYVTQRTRLDGPEPTDRVALGKYDCSRVA